MNVRCYTCNTPLAHRHAEYISLREKVSAGPALDALGMFRMCCRLQMLCHVDIGRSTTRYGAVDTKMDSVGTVLLRRVHHARTVDCEEGRRMEDDP